MTRIEKPPVASREEGKAKKACYNVLYERWGHVAQDEGGSRL